MVFLKAIVKEQPFRTLSQVNEEDGNTLTATNCHKKFLFYRYFTLKFAREITYGSENIIMH